MNSQTTFKVTFSTRGLAVFLEMLRYDGSTVLDWDRETKTDTFTVKLQSSRYTPDRWNSFGLYPAEVR